jgi:DNA-binding CsgD family transcriptional regulator
VIHSGLYYRPGSLKAATEITGYEALEVLGRMRHEDVAFLILVLRQVPFPLQLLTRLDALLTRFAAPQEPRGPPAPPRPLALTPREREILRLLAAGKTAKPIATELAVSLPTVRTHIQNLLCKLEVHSCLEAVVWYFRGRLADPESRSWRPPGLLPLPRP